MNGIYFYIIGVAIVALVIGVLIKKPLQKLWKVITDRISVMKKYWAFVGIYLPLLILAYWLAFRFSPQGALENNLSLVNHFSALIFAIFVGYFAFLQVIESRLDKLVEQGKERLSQKNYKRAIEYYEQAHKIAPRDHDILSELLETYLFNEDTIKFDDRISALEKLSIEIQEVITWLYLKSARQILAGHLPEANKEIESLVKFVQANPTAVPMRRWSFSELAQSKGYSDLRGDLKKNMDNMVKYLKNSLGDEREKFEGGNYLLTAE